MEDSTLLYIASTYGFIRSRLFTNKNNRRLKRDILSVSEANISEANISEANTNALHSQEVETIIREIIDEVISEANVSDEAEKFIREIIYEVIDEVISEAMKVSVSETEMIIREIIDEVIDEKNTNLSESINIDDSWYGFDNLKIYHCHIPIVSNELSDSGDDF